MVILYETVIFVIEEDGALIAPSACEDVDDNVDNAHSKTSQAKPSNQRKKKTRNGYKLTWWRVWWLRMEREGAKDLLRMRSEEDSRKSSCFLRNFLHTNRDSGNKIFNKRKMYIETAGLATLESGNNFNEDKADMVKDVDVKSEPVVGAMLPMSRSGGKPKLNLENRTRTIVSPCKEDATLSWFEF